MISSLGWMLWNNPGVGRVTLGKTLTTWQAYSSKILDYWICAGDNPAEIEETYRKGYRNSAYDARLCNGILAVQLRYQTQEELLEVAREYKKGGLFL